MVPKGDRVHGRQAAVSGNQKFHEMGGHTQRERTDDLYRYRGAAQDSSGGICFFTQYGVRSLIAVPFSKRLNQGYIGVDNPKRYGADPAFLFIIAYAVAQELNEIKLNKEPGGRKASAEAYCRGSADQLL